VLSRILWCCLCKPVPELTAVQQRLQPKLHLDQLEEGLPRAAIRRHLPLDHQEYAVQALPPVDWVYLQHQVTLSSLELCLSRSAGQYAAGRSAAPVVARVVADEVTEALSRMSVLNHNTNSR